MPRFSECWRCAKKGTSVVCSRCQIAKYCSGSCQTSDQARHKADCDAATVNKTCNACGKTDSNLKACSSCSQVLYCNINCQTEDWPRHKKRCKYVESKIKSIARSISIFFSFCAAGSDVLYYWGNRPAFDCLNLSENEGYDYKNHFNLLFYGVGDLRNVALTCASLPDAFENQVNFTLNDIEPCTLARLVLLLYMLIKGESGIEEQIVEVWYSVKLSEQTYHSLRTFLQELLEITSIENGLQSSTRGLVLIRDDHLKELRSVWKTWLDLPVMKTTWIQEQRQEDIDSDPESESGNRAYYHSIPSEHVRSAKKWMKNGFFSKPKTTLVAENPTLTGRPMFKKDSPFSFCCSPSVFPFTGWDYLEVKKFKYCDSIVDMYRIYVGDVLKQFKQKFATNHINFQVVLGNCMKIDRFLDPKVKYDRILTSNLSDYIPYPQLLKSCSERLNHGNPYATIVTETHNWTRKFSPGADVIAMNPFRSVMLMQTAREDTKNFSLVMEGGGTSIREYNDNSDDFLEYLRASFYAFSSSAAQHHKLPSSKTLGNDFQLQLRDYLRNENRLGFFKLAVNCRRATMIAGVERTLEWTPMKKRPQRDEVSLNF